ncbi:hypothetical protein F4780DRAFT_774434 [Xylariomycetidae sp. FL0641]|nr:hypothetical protein F4780DRAFT_774434 [Xylariomycetidae sp. FL0641]
MGETMLPARIPAGNDHGTVAGLISSSNADGLFYLSRCREEHVALWLAWRSPSATDSQYMGLVRADVALAKWRRLALLFCRNGADFRPPLDDQVLVVRGRYYPLILTPAPGGEYQGVGVHGLMDGDALLGSLPSPWRVRMQKAGDMRFRLHYYKAEADGEMTEDPSLAGVPIPASWEPASGESINSDTPFPETWWSGEFDFRPSPCSACTEITGSNWTRSDASISSSQAAR